MPACGKMIPVVLEVARSRPRQNVDECNDDDTDDEVDDDDDDGVGDDGHVHGDACRHVASFHSSIHLEVGMLLLHDRHNHTHYHHRHISITIAYTTLVVITIVCIVIFLSSFSSPPPPLATPLL